MSNKESTYEYSEKETASLYFSLRKVVQRNIKTKMIGDNFTYNPFLQLALTHMIYVEHKTDYKLLHTYLFRYALLLCYVAYRDEYELDLKIKEFDKIVNNGLKINHLDSGLNNKSKSVWVDVFNKGVYSNEFIDLDFLKCEQDRIVGLGKKRLNDLKEEDINERVKLERNINSKSVDLDTKKKNLIRELYSKVGRILYKQQDYFKGNSPLFDATDEERDNFMLFPELICEALFRNNEVKYQTFEHKLTFLNSEAVDKYVEDSNSLKSAKQILGAAIIEAIESNKTKPGDVIQLKTQDYYRFIMGNVSHGSFSNILITSYDNERSTIVFDYDLVSKKVLFDLDDTRYVMNKEGINRIK